MGLFLLKICALMLVVFVDLRRCDDDLDADQLQNRQNSGGNADQLPPINSRVQTRDESNFATHDQDQIKEEPEDYTWLGDEPEPYRRMLQNSPVPYDTTVNLNPPPYNYGAQAMPPDAMITFRPPAGHVPHYPQFPQNGAQGSATPTFIPPDPPQSLPAPVPVFPPYNQPGHFYPPIIPPTYNTPDLSNPMPMPAFPPMIPPGEIPPAKPDSMPVPIFNQNYPPVYTHPSYPYPPDSQITNDEVALPQASNVQFADLSSWKCHVVSNTGRSDLQSLSVCLQRDGSGSGPQGDPYYRDVLEIVRKILLLGTVPKSGQTVDSKMLKEDDLD